MANQRKVTLDVKQSKLLIISNNVLSETMNNGKTILSYIDVLPKENVRQLYFSAETPAVSGYKYYRISDKDVLKRRFFRNGQHGAVDAVSHDAQVVSEASAIPKNALTRLVRELIWIGTWKSEQLLLWLDDFAPASILFVGGDCIFAYRICMFIAQRYRARLTLYLTDDYIMPHCTVNVLSRFRRMLIRKTLKSFLKYVNVFYTISQPMQEAYKQLLGKDSLIIANLTNSMKDETINANNGFIYVIYTGSLYYGRDETLGIVSQAAAAYNQSVAGKKVLIKVYSNTPPDDKSKSLFEIPGCCIYSGSLNPAQLKAELNKADMLLFVESFQKKNVIQTKYSLSTKVPEYLSLGKPIFAVGPREIASIQYLSDAGLCAYDPAEVSRQLNELLTNEKLREELSLLAERKYADKHGKKESIQKEFIGNVLGIEMGSINESA